MRVRRMTELELEQHIFEGQKFALLSLILTGLLVALIEWFRPEFFTHPNLSWWVSKESIFAFWPLFVYCAWMAVLSSFGIAKSKHAERIFALSLITSVLAGIWEEIGFRWLFICTAMVGLAFGNWLWGTFAGLILGAALGIGGLALAFGGVRARNGAGLLSGFMMGFSGGFMLWLIFSGYNNPVYWMYDNVIVPFVDVVTLGEFHHVIRNPNFSPLFVFGMIVANSKFRDGHKYQGPIGMLNAWVVGFVMMHAAVTYGIGTAVVLHALYDVQIATIQFVARKLFHR